MSEQGQLFTSGSWTVKAGKEEEFIRAWDEFAKWSSQHQPGARHARLLQDTESPNRFLSFGPWESAEQIAEWRATPEFATFLAKGRELCEEIQPRTLRVVAQTG